MTRLLLLATIAACADTPMTGLACDPEESGTDLDMTTVSSVGESASALTEDLTELSLPVVWTDGPLTGDDAVMLTTVWTSAVDVAAEGTCTERAGLYVEGQTELSTTSGALSASGTMSVWFPVSDPASYRFITGENALPIASNAALEAEGDSRYGGAGERLWMSAWLDGASVGVDASYGGGDVVETGHVLVGTLELE